MGGFEFVEHQNGELIGPEVRDGRRTLTPYEVVMLEALGYDVELPVSEIKDKSKAVLFTKLLTTGQALWMVVQVLVRHGAGLPITLLEFNTVLHVICALVAWFAWLRKPKDIRQPTKIYLPKNTSEILCLLHVKDITSPVDRGRYFQEPDWIWQYTPSGGGFKRGDANRSKGKKVGKMVGGVSICDSTMSEKFLIRFHTPVELTEELERVLVDYSTVPGKVMGKTGLTWENYCKVVKRSSVLAEPAVALYWIVNPTKSNIYQALDSKTAFHTGVLLMVLSAIYGAIHCATWNSYFPTVLERYLWRFSGITTIVGMPVSSLLLLLLGALFQLFKVSQYAISKKIAFFILSVSLYVPMFLYFCARLYMIVEGFISLRSLPESAYENIQWLDMWPHF